jgi:transcriptional regulator with XRE-family HTH domain
MTQSQLRAARIKAGFSLEFVARPLGRTRAWLSMIETGKSRVSTHVIGRIAQMIEALSRLQSEVDRATDATSPAGKALRNLRLP